MDVAIVSIVASSVTAIASLICGVIIAERNNKYQLKVKKFEILANDKEEAFKNYTISLEKLFHDIVKEKFIKDEPDILLNWHKEYVKHFSMVMLFANKESKGKILEFNKFLNDFVIDVGAKHSINSLKSLFIIIEEYSKDIEKYEIRFFEIIEVLSKDLNTVETVEFKKIIWRKK